jgi:DNA-directed RNA polymerase II subunit RPB2
MQDRDAVYALVDDYVRQTRLVAHQVQTFDEFLLKGLQNVVNREQRVCVSPTLALRFGHVRVDKPTFDVAGDRVAAPLYPNEARLRNLTYASDCFVNITVEDDDARTSTDHIGVPIGRIPIMIGSAVCRTRDDRDNITRGECENDPGGYFIVNGKERVLIGQLRPAYDRVYVSRWKLDDKYAFVAEIRSVSEQSTSVLTQAKIDRNAYVWFSLPYIKTLVPAGVVFQAIGTTFDDAARCCSFYDDDDDDDDDYWRRGGGTSALMQAHVARLAEQYALVPDADSATRYIVRQLNDEKRDFKYIANTLANELFYHVGKLTPQKAAVQLGFIVKQLVATMDGRRAVDDKNNIAYRRVDSAGALMTTICQASFKQLVRALVTQSNNHAKKPVGGARFDPIAAVRLIDVLTNDLVKCFSTGTWTVHRPPAIGGPQSYARVGVSQVLTVQNYGARLSHLRRVMVPNGTKCKKTDGRQLHASHFSFLCPYETPEGETVGLVSSLAIMTELTTCVGGARELLRVVATFVSFRATAGVPPIDRQASAAKPIDCLPPYTPKRRRGQVIINGRVVGMYTDAYVFRREFDACRANGAIPGRVSIAWLRHRDEIYINSDAGRFVRPLLRVVQGAPPNGAQVIVGESQLGSRGQQVDRPSGLSGGADRGLRMTRAPVSAWYSAIASGAIVWRDALELEYAVVAMTRDDMRRNRCDYAEICPAATMFGTMAAAIPFPNYSQSPRIAYQSNMGKQAIGMPALSYQRRFDTSLNVIDYAQRPLTRTRLVVAMHFDEMSHGNMPIVAIMTHGGFNQEDSLILNKASIERGLFSAQTYRTIVEEESKRGNSEYEMIGAPKYELRRPMYDYTYMGANGVIKMRPQLWLRANVVLIGKTAYRNARRTSDGAAASGTSAAAAASSSSAAVDAHDCSVVVKLGEEGYLDAVYETTNSDGMRIIKVRTRTPRFPEIGDKFASQTAQKATCGMICASESMPFDADGVTPDLIINPHAIPSRMTVNMLVEMASNLVACQTGRDRDATPFECNDVVDELHSYLVGGGDDSHRDPSCCATASRQFDEDDDDAMDEGGDEHDAPLVQPTVEELAACLSAYGWVRERYSSVMYCGATGARYDTVKFMAPAFYQRLKHLVSEKSHARTTGPLDAMTHQPVAGRSRDGGLKFGEMERDAQLGHGATRVAVENLRDQSDRYVVDVCRNCGIVPHKASRCQRCLTDDTERVMMAYASKQFNTILNARGIKTRLDI